MSLMKIKRFFSWLLRGGLSTYDRNMMLAMADSQQELLEWCTSIAARLDALEKQSEATRRKVYRDEEKSEVDKIIEPAQWPAKDTLATLRAGEPVPAQFMSQFGGM